MTGMKKESVHMNDQKKPLEWVVVKDVTDEATGLTVRVSRAEAFRPRFSFQTGKLIVDAGKKEPRFVRYVGVFTRAENGVVAIDGFHTVMAKLLAETHEFIHRSAQAREDEIIESKQFREKKDLDRDKPKQRPGLKALRKQDAERYAQKKRPNEAYGEPEAKEEKADG